MKDLDSKAVRNLWSWRPRAKVFLAIAKSQRIGDAAKVLRLTPSAASHALGLLEAHLGTKLFDRIGRNIVINAEGRKFEASAYGIIERLEALEREYSCRTQQPRGLVRISATDSLAAHWVSPVAGVLMTRFPKLSFDVLAMSSRDAKDQLEASATDFTVTYSGGNTGSNSTLIATGPIVPVVRLDHPVMALPKKERWEALAQFPVALPRSVANRKVEDLVLAQLLRVGDEQQFIFDSYEAALQYLRRSNGWTFLPAWFNSSQLGPLAVVADDKMKSEYRVFLSDRDSCHPTLKSALVAELTNLHRTLVAPAIAARARPNRSQNGRDDQ